jgi:hypothetical protein
MNLDTLIRMDLNETYNKICMGNFSLLLCIGNMSDTFPI